MRLFIDTSVLISAMVFSGNEYRMLQKALDRNVEVYISEHILDEAVRVMSEKFPEYLPEFNEFLNVADLQIIPKERYIDELSRYDDVRDKYDRHVLACAIAVKCEIIVSSDKDLLEYGTGAIKIYNAKTVLDLL